jgi:hypothetical protein
MSAFLLLGCNLLGGASADHQDLLFAQRTVREVLNRSADAPSIDGKLRRGLVKIRTAIQVASANSNSGDETRCREEDNKANSGVCCALSLSAVAELRAPRCETATLNHSFKL